MNARSTLTAERLRELLHYDPETGVLVRLVRTSSNAQVGGVAGGIHKTKGYVYIRIDGKSYKAHRLAWFWMTGAWPTAEIDHINGVRHANQWSNLREASHSINAQNLRRAQSNNETGFLGVSRVGKKYRAQITINGKNKNLGHFLTPELAYASYLDEKRRVHIGNTL